MHAPNSARVRTLWLQELIAISLFLPPAWPLLLLACTHTVAYSPFLSMSTRASCAYRQCLSPAYVCREGCHECSCQGQRKFWAYFNPRVVGPELYLETCMCGVCALRYMYGMACMSGVCVCRMCGVYVSRMCVCDVRRRGLSLP